MISGIRIKKNAASQFVYFMAWNSSAAPIVPRTGDSANISMFVALNGANEAAASNSPAEVDATNLPGVYRLELTQAETNADSIIVGGTSSTSDTQITNTQIHPEQWLFDGLTLDSFMISVHAASSGLAVKTSTGVTFKDRSGTTKLTITHDTIGNRTASVIA